ncbi:MAG: OmpA family protein [Ignavibacteriales bacterium]|nr:OmpA family protein [Ignavibacteriales bacterium]
MKKLLLGTTLLFLLGSLNLSAQVYTDQWRFGLGVGYPRLVGTDAGGAEFNVGGYASIQLDLSEHVGLRMKPFYTHLESQSAMKSTTDLFGAGFTLNYYFVPEQTFSPYLSLGFAGFLQQINKPVDGKEELIPEYSTDLGFGFVVKNLIAKNWDLNAEITYHSVTNDRLDGTNGPIGGMLGGRRDSYMNVQLGVLYNFGFGPTSKYFAGYDPKDKELPLIERYPVYKNSWKWGVGLIYPRFAGTDELGKEGGFGGYLEIGKVFNEYVTMRFKPSFIQMKGSAKDQSTQMINGQIDVLYKFLPYEPVSPYIGMGGSAYMYAVNKPTTTSIKDGEWQFDYGFNLLLGADWKLFHESYSITTEVAYNTVSHDRLDGNIAMSSPVGGFLGGPYDSYMTFSVGLNMYLDRGDKADGPTLYGGVKDDGKAKDKDPKKDDPQVKYDPVDYAKIEEIVKKYQSDPVDYNKIEDMIKQYSGKDQTQSWVLYGVNFDFAKADLRPESYPILNHASQILLANPGMRIEVGGHTDAVGNDASNISLSEKRAQAVMNFLIEKGVDSSRLTARGYGSSSPVADNGTAEGRAMNRRVEFKVLN